MEKVYRWIVKHQGFIIILFTISCLLSGYFQSQVKVNYDMNDYLPSDSLSTKALDVMEEEFAGGVPNARIMIPNLSVTDGIDYKEKIAAIDGVTDVLWLDDAVNIREPLQTQGKEIVEDYYKDNHALYSVTIEEHQLVETVDELRELIGEEGSMSGTAVNTAVAAESTVEEIGKIIKIAVPIVLIILLITTNSWFEPIILLGTIGVAILLNDGTNIFAGTISFVTSGAGSILQLAVSLDYSVFLLHRFEEHRKKGMNPEESMVQALMKSTGSILSSGLTTGIGFAALILMRFKIGPDLGIALAKGIILSLLTVFILLPVLILKTHRLMEKTKHKPLLPEFKLFGKAVTKMMIPMVIIFGIVVIPSLLAQAQNKYYYGAEHIFGPSTTLGQDTQNINDTFGQSNTMVVLVPKGDTATELQMSNQIKEIPEINDVISFVDKAGPEIPLDYVDEDTLSSLESEHFTRMIISAQVEYEGERAFGIVEEIRKIAEEYYPDSWYVAGESVSTYDLMDTIIEDNARVNLISVGAIFIVLALTFHSLVIPIILVLSIETAVWINLAIPYFNGSTLFYFSYLIVGSIHLGATVDYAILMTSRYLENREHMLKKEAVKETISVVTVSVLTSGTALVVVGFLLGYITSHGILRQLGTLLGRGAIFSMVIVFFVLPGLLYLFDGLIEKTTKGLKFMNEESKKWKLEKVFINIHFK